MKILLLGGNGFGNVHARSLAKLGYRFSVFSRKDEVLKKYREEFGVSETYSDLNEAMLSDCDVVDIVMPHHMHCEIAVRAMEMGKHVIIEKPISTTLQEADKMINASMKNRVKFMVAEQYYFDRSLQKAIKYVEEGKIGKVHTIIVRNQRYFDYGGWRKSEKEMGGGALIDGGIHFMEAFLDIGGDYDDIKSFNYRGGNVIGGEDTTMAMFSFKSGARGLFFYSWAYRHSPKLPAYEIVGTDGSIVESTVKGNINTSFGRPVLNGSIQDVEEKDVIDMEISGFLRAVEDDREVPYPLANARRNLSAVLKIYENGNL